MEFVLYTRRLNQDCLENFFGNIRSKNGSNHNPTSIQFCHAFRQIALNSIMTIKGKNTNCMTDNVVILSKKITELCRTINLVSEKPQEFSKIPIFPALKHTSEFNCPEKNSFQYVCGFVLKKCIEKHFCNECKSLKEESELTDNLFLYFKQYENAHLVIPSSFFTEVIIKLENIFVECFQRNAHKNNIRSYLTEKMHQLNLDLPPCFPKDFLITYYIDSCLRICYQIC